jgi:hypothetical protein
MKFSEGEVLEKLAQLKVHVRGREASLALNKSSDDSKATTSGDSISLGEVGSVSSKAYYANGLCMCFNVLGDRTSVDESSIQEATSVHQGEMSLQDAVFIQEDASGLLSISKLESSSSVEEEHASSNVKEDVTSRLESSSSADDPSISEMSLHAPVVEQPDVNFFPPASTVQSITDSSSGSSVLVISSESFVADNLNHDSHEEMTSTIDEISGIDK